MSDSEHLLPSSAVSATEVASKTVHFVQKMDSTGSIADLLTVGTPLGHYVIKRYVGGGGMGRVYLATDEALDRDVAIKVLTQQRANDQGTVARFMNEAKSAARLNHEHIAQVYFAGEESGIPYIAFEYVEGINLRTMVEEHDVFPLPQALNYLLQIAHALAHAATHGVIHRDVKPSNILITREGRAKLIDMGLARLSDTAEARNDLTASGVTLGTFDYISPEQARDPRNADIRSDIYSLGCTFFFMLAGRPPFPEGTVLQKLLQHQGDAPPDIRSFQPMIPAEIAFLIQRMMAKDPKQRFQTPTVLIEALTDAARHLGLRPTDQGNLIWTRTQSRRASLLLHHLPWIMAVSLLFLGFFLMTLFSNQTETVSLPDQPSTLLQTTKVAPPSAEAAKIPPLPFNVAFVSLPAAPHSPYSAGLALKTVGGSLQPALMVAGHLVKPVGGQLGVTDFEMKKQNTTAQHIRPFSNVRYVDPTGNSIGSYPSLASALTDAEDETIIKLQWNNALPIREPIQLDSRKLQFVAAEGYDPILLFEPTEWQNSMQNTRSFFTVFSSNLEFQGVGIEIRLDPNVLSPHWSLFELSGNTRLTFEKCCLTVRNRSNFDDSPYHDDVVFFRNGIPTGNLEGASGVGDMTSEPLTIQVTDSLLRGEAVAIQSNIPQDINVRFSNSLIALARSFILIEESRRSARQATIQIRWNKTVFWGRQGIANLYKDTTAKPMVIDFDSQQSVFVLNRFPFAVFRGLQPRQKVLDDFRWSGSANYFQGVTGLRFRFATLSPDSGSEMPLEEWRQQWTQETRDQTKIDTLALNEIGKSMSRYLPQDMRAAFGLAEGVPFPNLDWFPVRWND